MMRNSDSFRAGLSGLKIDIIMILVTIALIVIGVMFIYSSEYVPEEYKTNEVNIETEEAEPMPLYIKQILFCIPSVILAFLLFIIRTDTLKKYVWLMYAGILVLLVLVLVIGKRIYGSKSWFGFAGFGVQPSEFAKLVVIMSLAKYIGIIGDKIQDWRYFLGGLAITAPALGLIFLQPDFGTVLVFIPMIVIMLFMGGCKVLHILTVTLAGIIAIIGGVIAKAPYIVAPEYQFLLSIFDFQNLIIIVASSLVIVALSIILLRKYKSNLVIRTVLCIFLAISIGLSASYGMSKAIKDHHIRRFISFFDPTADPQNTGYSLKQSIVAIGAGGPEGQGWLEGKQNHLGFITVKWADYIFSVYAEEMGYRGTVFLLILYGLLVFRGIMTIYHAKDMFSGLVATGIVSVIIFQVFINLGVTIGILPVVGITLPFLSAGGSSIMTFIACIGLMLNIQYEGKSARKQIVL